MRLAWEVAGSGPSPATAEKAPPTMPLAALRILVGLIFVIGGVRAAIAFEATVRAFGSWHVPAPVVAVPAIAATAMVCGALLALGALTRPVALLLATIAIGAMVTAGRYGGGPYLVVAPALFVACVVFAWHSGRQSGDVPSRPPGVQ